MNKICFSFYLQSTAKNRSLKKQLYLMQKHSSSWRIWVFQKTELAELCWQTGQFTHTHHCRIDKQLSIVTHRVVQWQWTYLHTFPLNCVWSKCWNSLLPGRKSLAKMKSTMWTAKIFESADRKSIVCVSGYFNARIMCMVHAARAFRPHLIVRLVWDAVYR